MPRSRLQPITRVFVPIFVCLAVTGCVQANATVQQPGEVAPTPTLSSLFEKHPTAPPLSRPTTSVVQSTAVASTLVPEQEATAATPEATASSIDSQLEQQFTRIPVYDDALAQDWTLQNSALTTISTKSTKYVDHGKFSIEATPKKGFPVLMFAIKKTSKLEIERKRLAGVRFRLNGGENYIPNDAMAVSILGSNKYSYWNANDNSVTVDRTVTEENPIFSETRLYYLGFDSTIPSDTWVDVIDWIGKLQYDPDYTYVTGFSIKVDQSLLQRYYIDQVELLLWPE